MSDPLTTKVESIFLDVERELHAAMNKFPTWPTDRIHAMAVVQEEIGELQKDILQATYEPNKTTAEAIDKEAIQSIAMLVRLLVSHRCGDYEHIYTIQHKQD